MPTLSSAWFQEMPEPLQMMSPLLFLPTRTLLTAPSACKSKRLGSSSPRLFVTVKEMVWDILTARPVACAELAYAAEEYLCGW